MSADRWNRVESLFAAALECETEQRQAFVAAAVEPDVRAEVLSLLQAHEHRGRLDSITNELRGLRSAVASVPTGDLLDRLRAELGNRYRVERELGRGGMAIVLLAEDLKHGRMVALKVLPPRLVLSLGPARFLQEIAIAARLAHPHILPLHDSGEADGLLYYVMPYVEGESLRDRLRREGRLAVPEALRSARQVADALGYAHSHGVIHCDVKPENIMLQAGHAVVTDFGIARAMTVAGGSDLCETGVILGTPAYMSPEQALGGRNVDARSDVYGLACVLYEMLAGEPLFGGDGAETVLGEHLKDRPPALTGLPERVPAPVVAAIRRAVARSPGDRFSKAAEFAEALSFPRASSTALRESAAAPTRAHGPWWRASALAAGVVVMMAVAWAMLRTSTSSPGEQPGAPETSAAAPGIAVLPFDVRGPEQDVWREGMVDLLSRSLDGATELRTIDSRTVLARWRESVPGGETPDAQASLEVARLAGAHYAVLGSVVSAGDRLRTVADVYELETGNRLGEAQADGVVDSIFDVVDRLSGNVLRLMVGERAEIPELDLARATTTSLPALKAYLEGEVHLRRGRFEEAIQAYRRGVAADSAFALAWLRLAIASGWLSIPDFDLIEEASARTARLIDQLPPREALLARGFTSSSPDGLEALRSATRRYPDDPLAWYLLGEFAFHAGGALLADPEERDRGFTRAIELDPSFSPAYIHAIENAMRTEPDSALVAGLIEAFVNLGPSPYERGSRLAHALAFGDDETRRATLAALDTLTGTVPPFVAHNRLSHPRFHDRKVAVLEIARERRAPFERDIAAELLPHTRFQGGELEAGLADIDHPRLGSVRGATILYLARVSGLPIPEERLRRALHEASPEDTVPGNRLNWTHFLRGAWALERDRPEEYERWHLALGQMAEERTERGDSVAARQIRGAARGLEGFAAWRQGRRDEAERALEEARVQTVGGVTSSAPNKVTRWWLAELALESGRLERAAEFFLSLSHGETYASDRMATLRLARVQEQLGRLEEARANYEWFTLAWRNADPELQPLVQDAARRLGRLKGESGV